jgi:signal transduction histidine kinase
MNTRSRHRIIIVDDNPAIHEDFRKLFASRSSEETAFDQLESEVLGTPGQPVAHQEFDLDSAFQGKEGLEKVTAALTAGRPYTVAFVDVRMPPGWDGIETIERLWQVDRSIQVVICTAYSDYSWEQVRQRLGNSDSLLVLKKPFDTVEVLQIAHTLTRKWELSRDARLSIEELDRKVAERTQALEQEMVERARIEENLRQSQKMEAVGQLAAGIAHDFNNLLTVIQGYAGLMSAAPDDQSMGEKSLREISLAAQRGATLIRQMLVFSRKDPVDQRALDLNEVLGRASGFLHRVIGAQIKLQVEPAATPAWLIADECSLDQIIMNLAVNARDAMPAGGVLTMTAAVTELDAASIRSRTPAPDGPHVCLTISDTGCGMDAATLSHIFEPFFTTKKSGFGTGLGLSTVYGIVQQHDGWIDVSSQPGQGTTFRIYFPFRQTTTPKLEPPAVPPPPRERTGAQPTILVAEDEPNVREFVTSVLKKSGYRVLEAVDGVDALELHAEHAAHVDLLFTDMIMPNGLSGRDLAVKLRSSHPDLKIIFSSGYSPDAIGDEWLKTSGVGLLPKPYTAQMLLQAVAERLVAEPQAVEA